ncbi:DUF3015 family protein [Pelagicoccus sp. SDUM812005]|uniref:DUF3015 family protein n=1 Tax=Pelagicoccus sp. SDUM812005 TaxID=3041257 RepID=UPI00280CD739|nr:DUF3015 family protein [Pelagicoccus sp. SDUM812005]MDQ8181270.1 DUF3015 family protein [Pelagicoccus sp. SDUM812005]
MIKMTLKGLSLLSVAALASTASARSFEEIYTDCGLGGMIAPNNDVLAVITNTTWDLGTTAISSNISSKDACMGGQETSAAFILRSYDEIAAAIARGEGEHLDTLLSLAGYAEEDRSEAASFLREDFAKVVAAADYAEKPFLEKAEALYGILYGEA